MRLQIVFNLICALTAGGANAEMFDHSVRALSSVLDMRCDETRAHAPGMRLACRWTEDTHKIAAYENGRSIIRVHTDWMNHILVGTGAGASMTALDGYFQYLQDLTRLQIDSIYLVYQINVIWRLPEAAKYSATVLQYLATRAPGGQLTHSLYFNRLAGNLKTFFGMDIKSPGMEPALKGWLAKSENRAHLESPESEAEEPLLGVLLPFVKAQTAEGSIGVISYNPIEALFRAQDPDVGLSIVYGLGESQVAQDWWELTNTPGCTTAGVSRLRLDMIPGRTCEWLQKATESVIPVAGATALLDADCNYPPNNNRGLNFYTAFGVGFEKVPMSLERLAQSVAIPHLTNAQLKDLQLKLNAMSVKSILRSFTGMRRSGDWTDEINYAVDLASARYLTKLNIKSGDSQ